MDSLQWYFVMEQITFFRITGSIFSRIVIIKPWNLKTWHTCNEYTSNQLHELQRPIIITGYENDWQSIVYQQIKNFSWCLFSWNKYLVRKNCSHIEFVAFCCKCLIFKFQCHYIFMVKILVCYSLSIDNNRRFENLI